MSFNGLPLDLTLNTKMIIFCVKIGHMGSACKGFDKMPERNILSWTTLLSSHLGTPKLGSCTVQITRPVVYAMVLLLKKIIYLLYVVEVVLVEVLRLDPVPVQGEVLHLGDLQEMEVLLDVAVRSDLLSRRGVFVSVRLIPAASLLANMMQTFYVQDCMFSSCADGSGVSWTEESF
ncbi:uncharacterized protein LOC141633961 isoform X3 [Silene latifolia]|uniref:uncharacterized protein LOC141633961 isoform X3 n=1 Tax=Silene latifolia TaxID=37657 RepID=UPI003D76BF99